VNVSAPFIKRPVATTLLGAAIALAGMIAFRQLSVASLPQVDFATITVAATLPGASPDIMASSVATPLERQFARIAGVSQMTSASTLGICSVVLQFDLSRDVDGAARDVEAAINAARSNLPSNLPSNPTYRKINSAVAPILVFYLTSDEVGPGALYDTAASIIQQKISQIAGVGQVQVLGSSLPAVRIDLNPQQVNHYGLGLQGVVKTIASQNSNRPKGQFSDETTSVDIVANDQISKASDYAPVILGVHDGAAVRLRDVGQVSDSVQTIRSAGFVNGKPAVILLVFRLPGANVIKTVDLIKAQLPAIRASIPTNQELRIANDLTRTIRASVLDVEHSLALSILLVIAVVFVFLRSPRATLIPGVAVALSLIGTFAVMYLCHYTLDNLSLMALTISTGFVVDDAIVVMENTTRHLELGAAPFEAAYLGAEEVGFTVLSMSLSLVAVFVPILFMGGIVGRLFHEFAATLVTAITLSMFISLTLTPMMCARLLRPGSAERRNRFFGWSEAGFERLLAAYRRSLHWSLEHPGVVLSSLIVTLVLNVALLAVVKKGFFPLQDTGGLQGGIQGPQDASFQSMRDAMLAVQRVIQADPAVAVSVGFTGGQGGPGGGASNTGFVFVPLKPLAERHVSAAAVVDRLRPKLAAVTGASTYLQASQDLSVGGRQSNAAYQYQVSADSLDDLVASGPALYHAMQKIPELKDVTTDQQDSGLQVLLNYDRLTAARLGITPQLVDQSLYFAYGESLVSTIYTPLNQYYVVMEAANQFLDRPSSLNAHYVHPDGGGAVPLNAVSHTTISTSSLAVNHSSFFPSVTVSFNLAPGVSLGQATKLIEQTKERLGLPSTLRATFAGTADTFKKSLASEPLLIVAALLAIYIVLGILYESLIHPVTILTTLPTASVGAVLALIIFRSELDVISLIGILLLIGIVKKNAIMMIDFALTTEREDRKSSKDAIFEACLLRFRPILMTTLAAFLGALPLAFGQGTGSELRRPLGIAIAGGLLVSQVLTLYTTPVVYLYFDRLGTRFNNRGRQGSPAVPAGARA
jgi:multidrug efflux pump